MKIVSKRVWVRAVAACGLVVAAGAWLAAQQPTPGPAPPSFRADTDVVRLEVSVLDNERRPVRGLTAADFTIREDGRERPVVAFTPVELPPVSSPVPVATWVRESPRDVVGNTGAEEGRLVVVAFDWSIRSYDQPLARTIAHAAVDGLGPTDRAAVIFTGPAANAGVPQNFTSDRALLRAAIDQTFATAEVDPREGSTRLKDPERYESGGCHCGRCALDTLARVAETLRDVSQRPKVVLFIGTYVRTFEAVGGGGVTRVDDRGGFKLGLALQPGVCNVPLNDARENMERAMAEANATIHVIDPVGLETEGNEVLGGNRIRERLDSLPVIADLTGGRTVLSTNAPELHVPAIFEESGSYYLVGFTPAATTRDGRSHRIDVRVQRPGVTVKARDRYTRAEAPVSAIESSDAGLVRTLGGVLPAADVPFDVSVVPLVTGGDTGTAVVVVGRLELPRAVSQRGMTILTAAFAPRGRAVASKRVELTPVGDGASASTVLGVVSGLALEPGLHEIRIAAELPSGVAGSVNTFVDVPDFRRAPLSMSGVLVHVNPEEPSAPREEAQGLPFVPTARRAFQRTEAVSAFVQISQGTARTDALQPVTVRVRIIDTQDNAVRDQALVVAPDQFASNRTASSRLALPVQNLPAGEYLLRLDAVMGERVAERTVRFEVR